MSTVYLAEDLKLERKVVVKVFAAELVGEVPLGRFKREVMLAANLQHPHIVGVITAGEADGLPFFTMPFVEGMSLSHRLAEQNPLPIAEAVQIVREVARACSYAHKQGIVHRDIKPDNVLLSAGVAMLADFGVAKALSVAGQSASVADSTQTAIGISLGTPRYMAPEQAAADPSTDHRADIYSLGATAYEMLAGRPPFDYLMPHELITAHISEKPRQLGELRSDIPAELEDLVMKCLEKDPGNRPQSAQELVDWLSISGVVSASGAERITTARARGGSGSKNIIVGVAIAIVVGLGAWLQFGRAFSGDDSDGKSLAVLPFVNTGSGDEYFADGMTDELTVALATVPGLRVASRTASFAFKGTNSPLEDIGGTLNVATLIEGTVRLSDSRVRLTAQMINVEDGLSLWSQTFDRELDDIFQVQEEVAQAIVSALQERFADVAAPETMVRRGTDDKQAYDLYIRASYLMRQRGQDQIQSSLQLFRDAIAIDPTYAAAYAGLADAIGLLPLYTAARIDSILPSALEAANRAVELDPELATARASLGSLLNSAWRWDEAAEQLRLAAELDPQLPSVHQWLGENNLVMGDFDAAARHFEMAALRDPMSPVVASLRGVALALAGDYQSGAFWAERALELGPSVPVTHFMAGAVELYAGDLESARREFEIAAEMISIPTVTGFLGYTYARLGLENEARALLEVLDPTTPNAPAAMAKIHIGLGNHDEALQSLELAEQSHDAFFSSEPTASPIFDPVRSDPRFGLILARIGLSTEGNLR